MRNLKNLEVDLQFRLTNIGFITFCFSLGCLGTPHPQFCACVSIVTTFLLIIAYRENSPFAERLIKLWKKNNKSKKEKEFIQKLEKRMNNIKYIIKEFPVYVLGMSFLSLTALGFIK